MPGTELDVYFAGSEKAKRPVLFVVEPHNVTLVAFKLFYPSPHGTKAFYIKPNNTSRVYVDEYKESQNCLYLLPAIQ